MNVAVAGLPPIDELDAELERALGALHELDFVELDQLVIFLDRRDRGFADSDRADRFALNQLDVVEALEQPAEQGRGHPSRSAAADDENLPHRQAVSGYRRGRPPLAQSPATARASPGAQVSVHSRGGTGCRPAGAGNR